MTKLSLSSIICNLAANVRAVALTGLSVATNAAITATDSILVAFGKLQAQITAHKGSKGTSEHGLGDGTTAGFSSNDFTNPLKTKLEGVATSANNYAHPTTDGNLHVPATGTSNNGKVLKAGSTAGSMSWGTLTAADVGAAESSHGNHVPAVQTANNAIFLRNDNTWVTVTPANIGAAATSHGNHVPATGTANNAIFLRNDNTFQTVTPANIGAAPADHASTATTYGVSSATNYGHPMASSATPLVAGTASAGTDNGKFAREGHIHPLQTIFAIQASAPSDTKLLWIETSTSIMRYHNGSAWTPIVGVYAG